MNPAAQLIYQINNMLGHKKTEVRTNSGLVPGVGVEPIVISNLNSFQFLNRMIKFTL